MKNSLSLTLTHSLHHTKLPNERNEHTCYASDNFENHELETTACGKALCMSYVVEQRQRAEGGNWVVKAMRQ